MRMKILIAFCLVSIAARGQATLTPATLSIDDLNAITQAYGEVQQKCLAQVSPILRIIALREKVSTETKPPTPIKKPK